MKTASCTRAWQAEAVADGRLAEDDASSFERHAASCTVCTRELRILATLKAAGNALPWDESSPLERRRQRQELLRKANELALGTPRAEVIQTFKAWLWPVAGFALVVAISAAFVGWPESQRATRAPSVEARESAHEQNNAAAPTFRVVGAPGARFRTLERNRLVRLSAEDGHFEIAVDKLHDDQRFLVMLPDGELEVVGTRFELDVHDAHTERVRVHEGRVALRLRSTQTRVLSAGDSWLSPPQVTSMRVSRPSASDAGAQSTPDASIAKATPRKNRPSAADKQRALTAGATFALAMAAFSRGDYAQAELLFRAFELNYPQDPRVEDSLFLRALGEARRGKHETSRAIARSYLERYPEGLRRREIERLAR